MSRLDIKPAMGVFSSTLDVQTCVCVCECAYVRMCVCTRPRANMQRP